MPDSLAGDERGRALFARYAHSPNALGYCGPPTGAVLARVAAGESVEPGQVARVAAAFTGAWPYQQVIGAMSGLDPLAEEVVRAYWTGSDLLASIDRRAFGEALLERIAPIAGPMWTHLTPDLLVEAAPTHAFHVFGVYPWSRLLATGRPEPLTVLESCRIGWGEVIEVRDDGLLVRGPRLVLDGALALGGPVERVIAPGWSGADVGDVVAIHWDAAVEVLTPERLAHLERVTTWQLTACAPRLTGQTEEER
ncbi:MAG: DUF6390 family protein [Mobilicoccus sp.]|nr:DUF6390 family protein [Mobilicoccus sp.]